MDENYGPDDCGNPEKLSRAELLEFKNTRKHSIFSTDDLWYELATGKGNVGFFKMRFGRIFVTRFGTYEKERLKVKGGSLGMFDIHVKLNGIPIIRGFMTKPDRWWQSYNIDYRDFNDRQYFFETRYSNGIFGGQFFRALDNEKNLIMHISPRGPYKPISFGFFMDTGAGVDQVKHALLFMLLEMYFEAQQNNVVSV